MKDQETKDQEPKNGRNPTFTGINIGGNVVTQATEHLPERQRILIRWLYTYARDNRWTFNDMVRQVGYSSSTWWRILQDKYRYPAGEAKAGQRMPLDKQCAAIARFKALAEQRDSVQSSGFVETSVWKRIDWLCSRVFVRQKIGFIYGESQIGKTTCLREHERRNDSGQTRYLEIPPSGGIEAIKRALARALNVSTNGPSYDVLDRVIDALDESKLIIADEIHRVFTNYQRNTVMKCMDTLRYIHDQSRCGLVLCGTNAFRDELQMGSFHQYLKQLRRRGLYEVQLPAKAPREDLDMVAARFGLEPATGEAEAIMEDVIESDGFGKFIIRLQDASELASKKRQKLDWSHFVKAHRIILKMALEAKEAA